MATEYELDSKTQANVKALLEIIGHNRLTIAALEDRIAREIKQATGVDIGSSGVDCELDIDVGVLRCGGRGETD